MNAIELTAVSKCYGDKVVVRDVDLIVHAGERLVLIGHKKNLAQLDLLTKNNI